MARRLPYRSEAGKLGSLAKLAVASLVRSASPALPLSVREAGGFRV